MTLYKKILFPSKKTTFDVSTGQGLAKAFLKWRHIDMPIETLCDLAIDHFDLNEPYSPLTDALIDVVKMADLPHGMPFHGNHHFREVFASTMRICHVHQQHATFPLSKTDILKCLIAAAGHDLNHDGTGNTVNDTYTPHRLEDIAFNTIKPVLTKHNIPTNDINDIHTIIRTTDMSSDGTHLSAGQLLRDTYAGKNTYLPSSISTIHHDKKLLELCAIVADADMTPTLGTTPEYSIYMSACFCKEQQTQRNPEKDNQAFLINGPKGFITPTAQKISNTSYMGMLKRLPRTLTPSTKNKFDKH